MPKCHTPLNDVEDKIPVVEDGNGVDEDEIPVVEDGNGVDEDEILVLEDGNGVDEDEIPVVEDGNAVNEDEIPVVEDENIVVIDGVRKMRMMTSKHLTAQENKEHRNINIKIQKMEKSPKLEEEIIFLHIFSKMSMLKL